MITKINYYFKYAFTALCLMLSVTVMAQNKLVKGTVVDQNNEPIIGATITIVGQNQGVPLPTWTVTFRCRFLLARKSRSATSAVSHRP